MSVTLLAPALAALLAAEPVAEPPPVEPDATRHVFIPPPLPPPPPTPAAPAAEWVTAGGDAPPDVAQPPRPPPFRPASSEWSLAAGWSATSLMGVGATGTEAHLSHGSHPGTAALTVAAFDLFVGETAPGLPVRSLSAGAELWTDGRLRLGGGIGAGVIAYERATSGEWSFLLTVGVRAGVELALFRAGAGEVVLGAHGALHVGPWGSGGLTLGYRGRGGPR